MRIQIGLLFFTILTLSCIVKAQNNYTEISLPELMKKKKKGDPNMVIVDVRTRGEYGDTGRDKQSNIGRIKGAINIPLGDLRQKPETIKQFESYKDKDIYLICSHSFRSRSASNILLKNGYTRVNNVRGGMTEWYRRYDELSPYREEFLETGISYKNISPSQLLKEFNDGKNILLLGINCPPRFFYDTLTMTYYGYQPALKNTNYYNNTDSSKIWELVQKEKGRPIVLFNRVNSGAAELAEWLAKKGVPDVYYLVGGESLFYEYLLDIGKEEATAHLLSKQSSLGFTTPVSYCRESANNKMATLVDIRPDTLFSKSHQGTKLSYTHLKNATHLYWGNGIASFEKNFPDKDKTYVLISEDGNDGLDFAGELAKKGYRIYWFIGGMQNWEWYMNNLEDFGCNELLLQ